MLGTQFFWLPRAAVNETEEPDKLIASFSKFGKRHLLDGVIALALGVLANPAWAQGEAAKTPLPEAAVTAQAADSQVPNAMTTAAVQRGMLTCAARVQQVTQFLGFGQQAGAFMMPPPAPSDRQLFAMQLETPAGAQGNSFVDASFAPNQANGCGATYTAVSYWPKSCNKVASQQFGQLKALPPLKRDVTVLDGGPATKIFLMRAGDNGCISIKKEIVL